MSGKADESTITCSDAPQDDSLFKDGPTVIPPNLSYDPVARKMEEAQKKISRLEKYEKDELRQLLTEGKTVDEAVAILKEKRRRKSLGLSDK